MMQRSFLTDDDTACLRALDERLSGRRSRWGRGCLIATALFLACMGRVICLSVKQAHRAATHSVPANAILYDEPSVNWVRGEQAQIHRMFVWAIWGAIMGPFFALFIYVAAMRGGLFVQIWRSAANIRNALDGDTLTSEDLLALAPSEKPPRIGRKYAWRITTFPASGLSVKDWNKRYYLYRTARSTANAMKWAALFLVILVPLAILLFFFIPIMLAAHAGLPWLWGYWLALTGYKAVQTYRVSEVVVAHHAALSLSLMPYFALILLLGLERPKENPRLLLRLIAETRRLDVLLWRKTREIPQSGAS